MKAAFLAFFLFLAAGLGFWWYQGAMEKNPAENLNLSFEEYQDGKARAEKVAEKVIPEIEKKLARTRSSASDPVPNAVPLGLAGVSEDPEPVEFPATDISWKPGAPVFIRIFKEERELELWLKVGEVFRLFETYPIAAMSGKLGPKLAEGDWQAPEGFYFVPPSAMKPDSDFHLAFNIGYPNAYDRSFGRTGTFIMVHGSNVSAGCFAMTDSKIEEIYTLCDAAHEAGQAFFRVHVFPFRMTPEKMSAHSGSDWYPFWQNLKDGYDWFETKRLPPSVSFRDSTYIFSED